ncbi:sulfite exporter TauE/SafE family protein [Hansschlegelia zhihuaiae]|uniref:Probable membrane transporter protein n=1 Tax=Hansschlegelia zhihuaiae TaxID=405005 RepID=A0A4Q0MP89_9HYPH|nr:sulfite exporter TauE/SafE family protein [Hansschlegelia zhihuaiae]RXF75564.1 sulfite exporter TauE/SafE family protein [Hansschlegelia zhihuaiae]
MTLEPLQYALGGLSGGLVGLTLGLFGGGGSILAVPLMVYLVGVPSPHMAIGTSAFAVAANAGSSLVAHARRGNVKWRCAAMFGVAGIFGALLGSTIGKSIDGQKLLLFFALLMVAVGVLMLRGRGHLGDANSQCTIEKAPKVLGYGAATGMFSGFFGIGGGFLIVPGLIASTGMPTLMAIGSSLVAVAAFGLATSLNYAASGFVDWPLALIFVAGGVLGGWIGAKVASRLATAKGALNVAFAVMIFAVAGYMIWRSISALA